MKNVILLNSKGRIEMNIGRCVADTKPYIIPQPEGHLYPILY